MAYIWSVGTAPGPPSSVLELQWLSISATLEIVLPIDFSRSSGCEWFLLVVFICISLMNSMSAVHSGISCEVPARGLSPLSDLWDPSVFCI